MDWTEQAVKADPSKSELRVRAPWCLLSHPGLTSKTAHILAAHRQRLARQLCILCHLAMLAPSNIILAANNEQLLLT